MALAAAGLTPAAAQAPRPAAPQAATPQAVSVQTPATAVGQTPVPPNSLGVTTPPAPQFQHMPANPKVGVPILGARGIQEQVTPVGRRAAAFHDNWLLLVCAAISIFVLGLLLYAIIRFRRGRNPTPSRSSHNTLLEFVWTVVPVLILVAIAVPSLRLLKAQYTPPKADITVKVTGHQWYWSYELPDYGVSFDSYMLKETSDPSRQASQRPRTDADGPPLLAVDERLVLPVGKTVKFLVTSEDVIHSFAVPAFWTKMDANPGQVNETWAKIERTGVYFGQCSELCGARHAYMPIGVEVVPQAQFAVWVASKGGTMPSARPPLAQAAAPSAAGQAPQAVTAAAVASRTTAND